MCRKGSVVEAWRADVSMTVTGPKLSGSRQSASRSQRCSGGFIPFDMDMADAEFDDDR